MTTPFDNAPLLPADAISWAPEVIADSSGKWCRNALRFATEAEALASANELAGRWYMVRATRAAPALEAVNYCFIDGRNVRLEEPTLLEKIAHSID